MVTTLAGVLWASLPDLRAQEREKQRDDVERHLEDGFLLILEGRPAVAIKDFEAALALDPDDPEAIAGLALARSKAGDAGGALAVIDRHPELPRTQPGLARVRQRILRAKGEPRVADDTLPPLRTAVDFFLAGYTVVDENWTTRSTVTQRSKDALALFDRAVALSPSARLLYHLHRARAAGRARDERAARAGADDIVELWPDQAYAWHGRGMALQPFDDDLTLDAMKRAQELRPSPIALTVIGLCLTHKGLHDEAIAVHRSAIGQFPEYALLHGNLGWVLVKVGRVDEGLAVLRESLRLDPGVLQCHANLAWALELKGSFDEAIAARREVVRIRPDDVEHRFRLMHTLISAKRFDDAITEGQEAIRIAPENPLTHSQLGTALLDEGNLDDAIAAFQEAIRLKDPDAATRVNLALALRRRGQLDAAIRESREAVRLHPDSATAHAFLAAALGEQGEYDEAAVQYQEAIRRDPNDAVMRCDLAMSLTVMGRFHEAAEGIPHRPRAWISTARLAVPVGAVG